jgi:hypothetical protein
MDDNCAHNILMAVCYFKRKFELKRTAASLDYSRSLRAKATKHLFNWKQNSVPAEVYSVLHRLSPGIIIRFALTQEQPIGGDNRANSVGNLIR